jgi:hypothetical protein
MITLKGAKRMNPSVCVCLPLLFLESNLNRELYVQQERHGMAYKVDGRSFLLILPVGPHDSFFVI